MKSTQTLLCARTETWAVEKVVALHALGTLFTLTYSRFLMGDVVLHQGVCAKLMEESPCPIT